jgi:hypothetical protein
MAAASARKGILLIIMAGAPVAAPAAPIIPVADGTTWAYQMTEEAGEGLGFSGQPEDGGKVTATVFYRLSGTSPFEGKELLKFEMHRAGLITNTDLMTVDERGLVCLARIGTDGTVAKLEPPQTMIAAPLQPGGTWDYETQIGETKVHQHFAVVGEEDVQVPAGKFRAYKIHGEQTSPGSTVIDRWFVSGVGIVKDVTTTRGETGELIRRIALELKEPPRVAPRPEVTARQLRVTVGKDAVGPGAKEFDAKTEKIYLRWQGFGLRQGAGIRAVWIAENVGAAAAPDSIIDEAATKTTAPESHGVFILTRPEEGWAPGSYRVEIYLDEALTDTAKLKITP